MKEIDYTPKVRRIFHPSDFTEGSHVAFAHALKFALITKADLTVLHVADDTDVNWTEFPGIRATLERWGIIPPGSSKQAVADTEIGVRKIVANHPDPVKSSLGYLDEHPTDLIVLATAQRGGHMSWLQGSVAEPMARKSGEMTLFVPIALGVLFWLNATSETVFGPSNPVLSLLLIRWAMKYCAMVCWILVAWVSLFETQRASWLRDRGSALVASALIWSIAFLIVFLSSSMATKRSWSP